MGRLLFVLCFVLFAGVAAAPSQAASAERPLRVVLIPADGGTEDGTKADYQPIFSAVSKMTGLLFDIRVGQSYSAVVEAMCSGAADIAFVGPVSYIQANQRHCAELLAVGVQKGQSIYYAGIFARKDAPIHGIKDLKDKRVAFGDVNSTSSFVFPVTMIMDAGLDPVRDLAAVRLTGSHANSLAALVQGQVDASALSFDSFDKAIAQKAVDPTTIQVVAKSMAIPYPPIIMSTHLSPALKAELKKAFAEVHKAPGVTPEMIRGYGGEKLDRYDTAFPAAKFNIAAGQMARLTPALQSELLAKASQR
ncbi:MAG TPA: phosphate/phosphite/phosphonate ABC transporter substrate-binding protein [Rhizomicrobium sp.]|jgi:phosphonate transport system substrate-binding protein